MTTQTQINPEIPKYKLIFLGDQGVGKSCILNRFMNDTFTEEYQATIGLDFQSKNVQIDNQDVHLLLYDTAGQEKFRSLIPMYTRDANIILLVYEVTSKESFLHLNDWLNDLTAVKKEDVIRVYWGPSVWYKLALPVMEKRKSSVTKISVSAVNNLTGQKYSSEVEKLESLEDIAVDTFQQAYSIMYARSLARSIARAVTNSSLSSLTDEANRRNDFGAALIFTTMDIAHKIATETVERADIRSSRYFPATASVAGINLEPGNYTVTVEFYSGRSVISKEVKKMTLRVKELNLVESVCLR